MNALVVWGAVTLAVAAPDLVTAARSIRPRKGAVWPLVSAVVAAHGVLGVAALLAGGAA